MKNHIKVLIVDDHNIFLDGVSNLIQDYPEISSVRTASSAALALKILDSEEVDLLISDISMPEMDGIQLSKIVKEKHPAVNILILSTHSEPQVIHELINLGVNGYILKNTETKELIEAILSIHSGDNYFSETVKENFMNDTFNNKEDGTECLKLSRREKEILTCIVDELTTAEIANTLCISQNTVNTHRKNLLAKLDVKNTAGLVKYAINNGLVKIDIK